jgi:peptide-methionine (S)-S-oxide reductase
MTALYGAALTRADHDTSAIYGRPNQHQQYLDRNKNGYCPDHGTGVAFPVSFTAVKLES